MIDFHSHILPGMDDGSASVDESLQMLSLSKESGVDKIVATPHFYAFRESPDDFLKRREHSWKKLSAALPADAPLIYQGAEVYYYTGISHTDDLERLCIGGTSVLLLEMPFRRWTESTITEAIEISQGRRMTVVLAHIDRYLQDQKKETWERLQDNGILFQVNASYFLEGFLSRRRAFRLLDENLIEVLGSDCHNMKNRRPNLDQAIDIIEKKSGTKAARQLEANAARLLGE